MDPLLELCGLTIGYKQPLLKDISFSLMPGEMLGILGRNGCGKTTLLRSIAGGMHRISGEVRIQNADCFRLSPKERARKIAVLPQQTSIMEGITAREILAMGRYAYGNAFLTHADNSRLEQAAAVFGIEDKLDTDCSRLSQGQRQLVLLAETLVQDSPVLLLDEPNTALDYDNVYTMFDSLRRLVNREKKGALLVLHNPEDALRWCDRLLLLQNGRQVGILRVKDADASTVQAALRQIYPSINVWTDSRYGEFRCNTGKL